MTSYRRQDVLRILEISARQLQAWERAGLVAQQELYTFQDLGQLRTLRSLREDEVPAASIRDSIMAMKAVAGMSNPLREARVVRTGTRLAFRPSRRHGRSHSPPTALRLRAHGRAAARYFRPVYAAQYRRARPARPARALPGSGSG
ncbi:MAG: MerR family transcriptional regulator [Terracidiphilus sp.]